ncbi:MAG: Asp-tRNA(Asn)/Glu-tRNA(Gln) amidotransferase subunit GatA [bacterium]|nr:Asp-tRNA(Asn)/Glu-tRNA(Gln) amidotransferase subunit GatA [bacterium]MDZ4286189.1 Asp-tRNA(Asn)/Glu-tRNA(Gln) amidotransferase subunit GatA [Candidatus Sungbacteria bacterium]
MKLNELTIAAAAEGLHRKDFSSVDLTMACLLAIREKDRDIHAFLEVFEEDAIAQAKAADEMFAGSNSALPHLLGIPLAIKDNILMEGKRCTAGSRMLENYTASYDATVIRALKKQGAVLIGKTNMDEFAMGSSTENSAFGITKNPRDMSRVPGGSSGGSAAAIAAHMVLGALGSDTGGSIRQPASFCGIVGMKPTYGSVSRHGVMAMASSLDQIGPMTKTVGDAEILWNAIAGKDVYDGTTIEKPDAVNSHPVKELSKLRIGLPAEYMSTGLDSDVKDIILNLVKKIEATGATIEEVNLPHTRFALPAYYVIVPSEVSSNLARMDGIRYGLHDESARSLLEAYTKTRGRGFGKETKRRIMIGTYALSAGYYDAYYLKAQKVRRVIRRDFEHAFEHVDLIIGPTTPTPAFVFGEKANDPLSMYLADIYTVSVNLAGLPALSLPAGDVMRDTARLPVGFQMVAPMNGELQMFASAKEVEKIGIRN